VSGWGLRLKLNKRLVGPGLITEHGFVDARWPSQKTRNKNFDGYDSPMYQKATTYVQNGRLIQAIAIAYDEQSDFSWEIGGEVQMWSESPPQFPNMQYSINVANLQSDNKNLPVLTVEGKFVGGVDGDIMCVDVAVFLNREPQSLGHIGNTPTEQSLNFTRGCSEPISLTPRKGQCVAAVFSLRDKNQKLEPRALSCPSWAELRGHLGIKGFWQQDIDLSGGPLLKLNTALVEKTGISQLAAMPDIITRVVEQLCSIAIHFEIEGDDSDYDSHSSVEPAQMADGPGRAVGMHDHEAGGQSVVSIPNNSATEPLLSQFMQEPYL
jgi:hypothetical protein